MILFVYAQVLSTARLKVNYRMNNPESTSYYFQLEFMNVYHRAYNISILKTDVYAKIN